MKRAMVNLASMIALGFGSVFVVMWLLGARPQLVRAAGPILYVATTGSDTTDCTNNASPCATVQYAVDQADVGAEIRVATGVYTDVHPRPRNDTVTTGIVTQVVYITKTVLIRGGYTTTNWVASYPISQPTTLDAGGRGRVLYIAGDVSPTIEGLRITGGDATGFGGGNSYGDRGGGIYVFQSTVRIQDNTIFSNTAPVGAGLYLGGSSATLIANRVYTNTAFLGGGFEAEQGSVITSSGNTYAANGYDSTALDSGGGGAFVWDSVATFDSDTFASNQGWYGGGLYLGSAQVTVTRSSFMSQSARHGAGMYARENSTVILANSKVVSNHAANNGGGLYLADTNATLISNTIGNNSATIDRGGGLAQLGGVITLQHNIVASNTATGYGGAGGGLYLSGYRAELRHNTIISNASLVGGGIYADTPAVTIIDGDTFRANSAPNSVGGALIALGGNVRIADATFISNTSAWGGGAAFQDSDVAMTNTVIANSQVSAGISGLWFYRSSLRALHTTVANNRGGAGIEVYGTHSVALTNTVLVRNSVGISVATGSTVTLEGTLWGSGDWANGADVGGQGTVLTGTVNVWGDPMFVDPDAGDYHIGFGSAARDAGVNAGVDTDIDGDPRPVGSGYDIGADEYVPVYSVYLPVVMKQHP